MKLSGRGPLHSPTRNAESTGARWAKLAPRPLGLLIAAAALLLAGPALAETRVALVIGNANYGGTLGSLSNPVNDAQAIRNGLVRDGFEVDLEANLDQRGLKQAIKRLGTRLRAAGPGATGLFYFGGHGLQVDGINYLVPVGADIAKEADADIEAVAADSVLKQMADAGNAVNIVILDACRNTPVFRGFRDVNRGLAPVQAPQGSFVAYSTAPGETAADGTGANSPFALALSTGLAQSGMPIEDLFRDVRKRVLEETGGRQTPWDSSALVAPFYFVPEGTVVNSATEIASVPPKPRFAPLVQQAVDAARAKEQQANDRVAQARQAKLRALEAAERAQAGAPGTRIEDEDCGRSSHCQYAGEIDANGAKSGYGVLTSLEGQRYEGEWQNGRFSGVGVFTWSDDEHYEGEYSMRDAGLGADFSIRHVRFEREVGEFLGEALNGYGVQYQADGSARIGHWKSANKIDAMNGYGARLDAQGNIIEQGFYENGVLKTPMAP